MALITKCALFVVGSETCGEFGENNNEYKSAHKKLRKVQWKRNIPIKHIFSGGNFNIYLDENDAIYCCGHNQFGSCGIGKNDANIISTLSKVNIVKVDQIWCSPHANNWYVRTQNNEIFAVGLNACGILGLNDVNKRISPSLLTYFKSPKNVVDIQCGWWQTIALMADGSVYSTSFNMNEKWADCHFKGQNGHGMSNHNLTQNRFHQIQCFSNIKIRQISTGSWFTLFLDINGLVYSCGDNGAGQLGHGHIKHFGREGDYFGHGFQWSLPIAIPYFVQNKIIISKIKTGGQFSVVISNKGECFSFGTNYYGECGIPNDCGRISTPTKMKFPLNDCIEDVQCGSGHSMAISNQKEYYFFGKNWFGECLIPATKYRGDIKSEYFYHDSPQNVNNILKTLCKNYKTDIIEISLGVNNTKIIVTNATSKPKIVDTEQKNNDEMETKNDKQYPKQSFDNDSKEDKNDIGVKKELCVICMDLPIKSVIVPCGHACICSNKKCKDSLSNQCPICRGKVDMVIPLFISGVK
eukprot:439541_1